MHVLFLALVNGLHIKTLEWCVTAIILVSRTTTRSDSIS